MKHMEDNLFYFVEILLIKIRNLLRIKKELMSYFRILKKIFLMVNNLNILLISKNKKYNCKKWSWGAATPQS